jgi:formate dehydrogenase major subunit
VLQVFDLMSQGKVNGYMCQGFNPIAALPDKNRVMARWPSSSGWW